MSLQEKARLSFDFESKEDAIVWFNSLKVGGFIPADMAAFTMLSCDSRKDTGITPANSYIALKESTRHENFRLKKAVKEYIQA